LAAKDRLPVGDSGFAGGTDLTCEGSIPERKANEFQEWIASLKGYEPISSPKYAGYDPLWTLPFLRRNEMMIEVKKKQERP
jgi:hypothetical protein